jgi:hypothetical protein
MMYVIFSVNTSVYTENDIHQTAETMAFLEQVPVRCKIIVDNKCLQQVKNFKYLSCEISYKNEKDFQQKVAKLVQILGILNNTFKPTVVQKSSRITVYNALALPFFYMEVKFGPSGTSIKNY